MTVKEGRRGRLFEVFEVGNVYEHSLGRTVTTGFDQDGTEAITFEYTVMVYPRGHGHKDRKRRTT